MKNMKLTRRFAVLGAAVAMTIASAAQAADTIKVGVLHSLSGTMAISETTLKDTVAKAKADSEAIMAAAQAEWGELSQSVPQLVDALQSRIDTLSKSRKLPKNVDKATFETIKTDFETVKTDWTSASREFMAGAAADAVRKARAARAKAEEIHAKLGMNT